MDCNDWTFEKRLELLPEKIRAYFIDYAKILNYELKNQHLKVVLAPAPNPKHADHKIRVVNEENPYWYSDLYYAHNRGKRKLFEKSIERIVGGVDCDFDSRNNQYNYDYAFRNMIYDILTEGYIDEFGKRVMPENEVRKYFGMEPIYEEVERVDIYDKDTKKFNDGIPF